jgi:hypothetical protein
MGDVWLGYVEPTLFHDRFLAYTSLLLAILPVFYVPYPGWFDVGTGTFGRVRLARHKASKKYLALKILKKSEACVGMRRDLPTAARDFYEEMTVSSLFCARSSG